MVHVHNIPNVFVKAVIEKGNGELGNYRLESSDSRNSMSKSVLMLKSCGLAAEACLSSMVLPLYPSSS